MKTYHFRVVLGVTGEIDDNHGDALFEAGCDDGTIVTRDEVSFIRFSRVSPSLEEAINSAASNIESAGLTVDHVEVECPV